MAENQVSYVGAGSRALRLSSIAFQGALASSWIRSGIANRIWDAGITGGDIICYPHSASSCPNFYLLLLSFALFSYVRLIFFLALELIFAISFPVSYN